MDDTTLKHIKCIEAMAAGAEYTINWCEESGALITVLADGYLLQDVHYGNIVSEEYYTIFEIYTMVREAESYI